MAKTNLEMGHQVCFEAITIFRKSSHLGDGSIIESIEIQLAQHALNRDSGLWFPESCAVIG